MADETDRRRTGLPRIDSSGREIPEIPIDEWPRIKTISEMTSRQWEQARALLRAFDGGKR